MLLELGYGCGLRVNEIVALRVEYLARYTHRIAIIDARILREDDERVTSRYKDYSDHDRHKTLMLERPEFAPPLIDAHRAQGADAGASLPLSGQPLP